MNVSDCMTRDVRVVSPDMTVEEAARIMAETDAGVLPVGENDRLVGMLTDRDIAIRAVGTGKGPETPIGDIMSAEVLYCHEDDDIDQVAHNMADTQVRRLPVVNREKRLVGIVALADLATKCTHMDVIGAALGAISRPGGQHTQSTSH